MLWHWDESKEGGRKQGKGMKEETRAQSCKKAMLAVVRALKTNQSN
jgi:hypothetical protein